MQKLLKFVRSVAHAPDVRLADAVSKNTTLSPAAIEVIPLRRRELPNVRELSSIFHPVISATVFPRLESSIQSGVPPVPLELIASVTLRRDWAWVDAW